MGFCLGGKSAAAHGLNREASPWFHGVVEESLALWLPPLEGAAMEVLKEIKRDLRITIFMAAMNLALTVVLLVLVFR